MTDGERTAFDAACRASERDLARSLHLLDVRDLQEDDALLISVVDGNLSLTDGPTRHGQLIQLLLIQARDLNTAIQIASKMPQAQTGSIEVRRLLE